ncbi:DUF6882 domain-containing protein [Flavobacterium suncheonense]|uniref:DUF6882 domain-containing protein n=1 Tax=Flavobacterium suncheonense TaxID=350894 RepID=UPI000427755C|nr:DUF6882 domain-containing protein [Flavobacterium suncheonense]
MKNRTLIIISIMTFMSIFSFFKRNPEQKNIIKNTQEENLITPKDTKEFEKLSKISYEYLNKQQEEVEEKYGIGKYENWFYDQEKGTLTFSDKGIDKIIIKYEEVGSISKISNTWLWSWANPHLDEKIKTEINFVKEYGKKQKLEKLIKRKWNADEYDGWEMTAISAYLMKAKGAYRVPTEKTFSFMIYKEIIDLRKTNK